jgi:membrane-bound metal-dependent hydrolase YbcI (DUF457 family)
MVAAAIWYESDSEGLRIKETVPLVVGCHLILDATPTRKTELLSGFKNGLAPVG